MKNVILKICLMSAMAFAAIALYAFQDAPKESAKALGATKGKPIRSGLVFINGKFIRPPYVVERRGTVIRVNKVPVTGQIVTWSELLKTQDPSIVSVTVPDRSAAPSPAPANGMTGDESAGVLPPPLDDATPSTPALSDASSESCAETLLPPPPPAEPMASPQEEVLTLDDLFNDDAPEGNVAQATPEPPKPDEPKAAAAPQTAKPRARPVLTLTGKFEKNDAAKALIKKINAMRTEFDRHLRNGGLLCFGDDYARIVGDAKTVESILKTLPEAQMKAETAEDLQRMLRAARLDYLHELVIKDFFNNRIDYRRIQDYRRKLRDSQAVDKMLKETQQQLLF